jgi:hypothetical protein
MSDVVTVIFIGLISHMDLSNNNTAVLPVATNPQHYASIYVKLPGKPVGNPIPIDGMRVHIYEAAQERPDHSPSFIANVPHIGLMTECAGESHLLSKILKQSHLESSADINAFVDYEGETLSADKTLDTKIKFNGAAVENTFSCVACRVKLIAIPKDGKTLRLTIQKIDGDGKNLVDDRLPIGTIVWVRNGPVAPSTTPQPTPTHTGDDHFSDYLKLGVCATETKFGGHEDFLSHRRGKFGGTKKRGLGGRVLFYGQRSRFRVI